MHLHSLQTLGAGLVHEAADRKLPVVVTLHDFWWWCARQFLCDRDLKPCCPVVNAGDYACEVDRSWLVERTTYTTRALERADRILPVSQSAASIALANGVDPERVVVIEPGTVQTGHHGSARREEPGVLRLLYAGGTNPMKGSEVMAEAARMLAETSGWRLTCYGSQLTGRPGRSSPSSRCPRSPPRRSARCWRQTDVLVVPSVVHESYSTLTREALRPRRACRVLDIARARGGRRRTR